MAIYKFQGRAYEHAMVRLNLFNRPVVGCTAISYSSGNETTLHHGNNGQTVHYTKGNETHEGSITLTYDEIQAIIDATPDGKIYNLPPFTFAVSFKDDNLLVKTHFITAMFTKQEYNSSLGNARVETELPLVVIDIRFK